ncbi:DUF58 domain-containing protein [Legionella dresdenensis]|uniref:DUF58 domain-containing protein n=1 Tax=Legionella dresdenensis TaxID=450200 RepID=A0ABV8CIH6_9GAMM
MNQGLVAELDELISLKRFARKVSYQPEGKVLKAGNHLSRRRGRGMDFAEVRNYQAGDEIRHMEWRVTARTGRPHVKVYQEERERPVVLLADFNPSMYFGTRVAFKSVIAAKLATLIAWTAIKQGDRVGALLYSAEQHNEFIPRSRETAILPLLSTLSRYTGQFSQAADSTAPAVNLSEALIRLRRVARPGSILVLISDFYQLDSDTEKHLGRLRLSNDVLAYHICDALELAPPPPAQYAITDGQREMLLETTDNRTCQGYQNWCDQHTMTPDAMFRRLQIQYQRVTADMDLARLVHQTFPRRKHA